MDNNIMLGNYITKYIENLKIIFAEKLGLEKQKVLIKYNCKYDGELKDIFNLDVFYDENEYDDKTLRFSFLSSDLYLLDDICTLIEKMIDESFKSKEDAALKFKELNKLNILKFIDYLGYGEEPIKSINHSDYMLASKATKKYNLSDSTIRRAIHDGRIINGTDCYKEGRDWYVSIEKLNELYGKKEVRG